MMNKILIFLSLGLLPLAVFADDNPCLDCHEELAAKLTMSLHYRVGKVPCAKCHTAATAHMEEGATEGLMPEDMQKTCFACHTTLNCDDEHCARDENTCSNCHSIHSGKGAALLKAGEHKLCESCHLDVKAQMSFPNHHPVPEGKMSCFNCHSAHSGFKPSEATAKDVNDLCWKCHASLQGPFIFEHEPVVEDCRICHEVHGSVADNLLAQSEPFLCLQCHEFHFHAGAEAEEAETVEVGGVVYDNRYGRLGYKVAYTTKCTQCHIKVHGSDLPSQSTPSRGRALTR